MNQPRLDITDSRDVARLVNVFYDRVRDDDILGPIFNDIAHVDWATHLPRMYDFWESVLFARATFKGAPLVVHRALARLTPVNGCRIRSVDRTVSGDGRRPLFRPNGRTRQEQRHENRRHHGAQHRLEYFLH